MQDIRIKEEITRIFNMIFHIYILYSEEDYEHGKKELVQFLRLIKTVEEEDDHWNE